MPDKLIKVRVIPWAPEYLYRMEKAKKLFKKGKFNWGECVKKSFKGWKKYKSK